MSQVVAVVGVAVVVVAVVVVAVVIISGLGSSAVLHKTLQDIRRAILFNILCKNMGFLLR